MMLVVWSRQMKSILGLTWGNFMAHLRWSRWPNFTCYGFWIMQICSRTESMEVFRAVTRLWVSETTGMSASQRHGRFTFLFVVFSACTELSRQYWFRESWLCCKTKIPDSTIFKIFLSLKHYSCLKKSTWPLRELCACVCPGMYVLSWECPT